MQLLVCYSDVFLGLHIQIYTFKAKISSSQEIQILLSHSQNLNILNVNCFTFLSFPLFPPNTLFCAYRKFQCSTLSAHFKISPVQFQSVEVKYGKIYLKEVLVMQDKSIYYTGGERERERARIVISLQPAGRAVCGKV